MILLPFWPPLIPPMGLACLKGFLQRHGFEVKAVDANVEDRFRRLYDDYFNLLNEVIPEELKGNFYNTGIDVLQNHMMAHLHRQESRSGRQAYWSLLKAIVAQNFFCDLEEARLRQLDRLIDGFYRRLTDYLAELLEEERPAVLGISAFKGTLPASLFAFRFARRSHPHIMTVLGGGIFADQLAVGSADFDYFLERTPYIDKIIVGEGELLFLKMLRGQLPPAQRLLTPQVLDGEVLALEAAELPDFSDFDTAHYPQMAAYTSRSCPFQCGFCAETVNWGRYRKKSVPQVADELTRLYRQYGSRLYLMSDSLLNPIIDDLASELLKLDLPLYWDGYLRAAPQAGKEENTFLWRRGGFYRARLGLESGSARMLARMNKGIGPGEIRAALTNLAAAGIKTSTYWVIGYPGETEADFLATLKLLEELKDDIYEAECNPFRFYLTGQVQSGRWAKNHRSRPLYPPEAAQLLILQTWTIPDVSPVRQEIYRRLNRFVALCRRLEIPNPYCGYDIYRADERWHRLHPNAVPPLVAFSGGPLAGAGEGEKMGAESHECRKVRPLRRASKVEAAAGDFDFTDNQER